MTARRKLTTLDKLRVMMRQANCPLCGKKLDALEDTQFDHEIALVNGGEDTLANLRGVHRDCHDKKTNGPGGEKRITTAGSDKHIARKTKRLAEQREPAAPVEEEPRLPPVDEFERRRLELLRPEPRPRAEKRSKWPSHPFRRAP